MFGVVVNFCASLFSCAILYYVLLSLLNVIKIIKAPALIHARARAQADSVCVKKGLLGQISLNDDYLNANQLTAISWGIMVND